jgi:hypothetical protein
MKRKYARADAHNKTYGMGAVTHACNLRYLEGRDRIITVWGQTRQKI